MFTLILLATGIPITAAVAYVAMRNRWPQLMADIRGIALQTVIIIVVLLAIAGAVAGVLISRGGQAVADLESEAPEAPAATEIRNEFECLRWNYNWLGDADNDGTVEHNLATEGCATPP